MDETRGGRAGGPGIAATGGWRQRARQLKREAHALVLAYRDPRVPWYARLLAACVVAYAFSPVDLIPDFIPLLGYVDDLLLVPLGIALSLKLIPPQVMVECRERARVAEDGPPHWAAAAVIIAVWIGLTALLIAFAWRWVSGLG